MKTSIFYYCAFAVVILSSVLFGLDRQSAPMSPMPPIQVVALPPPPVKPVVPVAIPSPAPQANPVAPNPAAPAPVANVNPRSPAPESANAPLAQTPPKVLCDIGACAVAYRSFRESDCTYNPSVGPRRLCTKGVVPTDTGIAPAPPDAPATPGAIANPEPSANPPSNTSNNARCNVSACAAAYRTFTESDCTFMATGGQRRLCTK